MKRLQYLLPLILIVSCSKFVEVPLPSTETPTDRVFTNDLEAEGAVRGIYGAMLNKNSFASGYTRSITFLCALSSDEMQTTTRVVDIAQFNANEISVTNQVMDTSLWDNPYSLISMANYVLDGLTKYEGVTPVLKKQLKGEAYFLRAFVHFYLFCIYGATPYLTTSDYRINIVQPRTSVDKIFDQLVADLTAAEEGLPNILPREGERASKQAATALLARVYLYKKDWLNAEKKATEVINSGFFRLEEVEDVFYDWSREAIWQLMPNNVDGLNTWEAKNFLLHLPPVSTQEEKSSFLNAPMVNAFESSDKRRQWIGSVRSANETYYFPAKYKREYTSLVEYSIVLRFAEQYLIRAEARVQLGDIAGAQQDLNMLRKRAGLSELVLNNKEDLMKAILQERRVELFAEWGHRWFDLCRLGLANQVLGWKRNWQAADTLFPLPASEIDLNRNLTQNPGY